MAPGIFDVFGKKVWCLLKITYKYGNRFYFPGKTKMCSANFLGFLEILDLFGEQILCPGKIELFGIHLFAPGFFKKITAPGRTEQIFYENSASGCFCYSQSTMHIFKGR